MAPSGPAFRPLRRACVCLSVTMAVSACHDAAADPTALLVTEETHPALQVEGELPSLPELVERTGTVVELSEALDLWVGSWGGAEGGNQAMRDQAYQRASGRLAGELGPAEVREAHLRLGGVLRAATSLAADDGVDAEMAASVAEAGRYHDEAARALEASRHADALASTLRGSDALRSVGPEGVARTLIARAEGRFEEARREGRADEAAMARGDRLLRGARMALEDGHWSRALRRAFYACQVLGVSPR